MTTSATEQIVKLRTPADVVEAVPHLVGFHPANSVVFIAIRGKRKRLGVVARFDLPGVRSAAECADAAVECLQRERASAAIVVFYPPSGGPAHPSVTAVADRLTDRLATEEFQLADVLCVSDGRWWSLSCDNADCCPAEGTVIESDPTSPIAAAMAVSGRVTLASREELARTLEPVGGMAAAAMRYAIPRARAALADQLADGGRGEIVAESIGLFYAAVERRLRERPPDLDVEAVARLIIGLDDGFVRDEVITWFEGEWGDATRALLGELVRQAVPPFGAAPLTVLGWLAYLHGDGAFAGIAVERALASGPGDGMARLLDDALRAGVNPSTFKPGMRALRRMSIAGQQH